MVFLYYAIVVVLSAFLGASMKIADLLDEHKFKWFKYSDVLFGLFWGAAGAILILQNALLATIWASVLFCFLIRYRIDYFNHGIAAGMWFLAILLSKYSLSENFVSFIYFASLFTITGLVHDYFQYQKPNVKGFLKTFFIDFKLYWYFIALIYATAANDVVPILTIWPFEYVYDFFSSEKAIPLMKKVGLKK